jgi:hypothetical protein
MRLSATFDAFMRDTVNLDETRLKNLSGAVEAIYKALVADDTIGRLIRGKDAQGSWAHRTIIKPVKGNEFDADFMLVLDEDDEWSEHPVRYINEVHAALSRNETYKSMVKPAKCRCVRVAYAGDFHVDIVPFLMIDGDRQVIVNGDEDDWEDTDPDGFTRWMKEKDDIAGGNLRLVIRLMKYLRDHGGNFKRTRSVILTAILGERVDESKKDGDSGYYGDLPTALCHIVNDLNDWLQENKTRPSIPDPSGATDPDGEPITFDHRWTDADYENLRSKIKVFSGDITAAYEEKDEKRSLELWQAVFGSDFKKPKPPAAGLGGGAAAGGAAASRTVQSGRAG